MSLAGEYDKKLAELQAISEKMAAAGELVKDQPHARVYFHALRELQGKRDRQALSVFLELVCHADKFGWCWPGDARLASQCGYAKSTIRAALERLLKWDYIRCVATQAPGRDWLQITYMVSPGVMSVRPQLQAIAWQQYNGLDYRNTLPNSVTNDSQPIYKPSTTNQSPQTNHHNQPPPPPQTAQKPGAQSLHEKGEKGQKAGAGDDTPPPAEKDQPNGQSNEVPSSAKPAARKASPPGSAAPPQEPELPDGFDGAQPIDDAECEQAAKDIKRMFDTDLSIGNARRLVTQYGHLAVMAEAARVRRLPDVHSPVGLMISSLRKKLVSDEDAQPDDSSGSPYTSGKYAEYVDS